MTDLPKALNVLAKLELLEGMEMLSLSKVSLSGMQEKRLLFIAPKSYRMCFFKSCPQILLLVLLGKKSRFAFLNQGFSIR